VTQAVLQDEIIPRRLVLHVLS